VNGLRHANTVHRARMSVGLCPICGVKLRSGSANPHRKSRDHILPLDRGGGDFIHGDTPNLAVMCQACNGFRARCFHCWALVACVRDVAKARGVATKVVYHEWRVGSVIARAQMEASAKRNAANRDKVRIGRIVAEVGVDEFVYPADTAAKAVWNAVTLARGAVAA
jgi:hypothetical protein